MRISRGHPSFNEVKFFYPPYRCVTIWLSFQNPGTPMARINRREGNARGATHPDAWFCDEITINCSVNCPKKVGWPQLNADEDAQVEQHGWFLMDKQEISVRLSDSSTTQ